MYNVLIKRYSEAMSQLLVIGHVIHGIKKINNYISEVFLNNFVKIIQRIIVSSANYQTAVSDLHS